MPGNTARAILYFIVETKIDSTKYFQSTVTTIWLIL